MYIGNSFDYAAVQELYTLCHIRQFQKQNANILAVRHDYQNNSMHSHIRKLLNCQSENK